MEMLQLRYFYESARLGSFAKTAEKYMVPASSVSITVKHLEKELGCQLFDRQSNRIIINDNGRKLQRALKNIFEELDTVVSELSMVKQQTVELNVLIRALRSSIMDATIKYQKLCPNIKFNTTFKHSETSYENYDIIVCREQLKIPGFDEFKLRTKRLRMVTLSSSELCKKSLTMAQLREQPFVLPSPNGTTYNILLNACERSGFVPKIAMVVNDDHYYFRCLKEGIGIRFTTIDKLADKSPLEFLNVTDFDEQVTYYAFYKKNLKCAKTQGFIDYLKPIFSTN